MSFCVRKNIDMNFDVFWASTCLSPHYTAFHKKAQFKFPAKNIQSEKNFHGLHEHKGDMGLLFFISQQYFSSKILKYLCYQLCGKNYISQEQFKHSF